MLSQHELLEHPNYLLSTYQLEIYRQLSEYMNKHDLKNKDIAEKWNVSQPYVSQVLNGNFNFTLKKLIELGLMINKVPFLEFVEPDEYWKRERNIALKNKAVFEQKNSVKDDRAFEREYSEQITSAHLEKKYGALSHGGTTKFSFINKNKEAQYA